MQQHTRLMTLAILITLPFSFSVVDCFSQRINVTDSTNDGQHKTVIAGKQYAAGNMKKTFWGEHYRKEWTTPVRVSVLHLDSAYGGLTPVEKGGGRQTKNLRLKSKEGKEYVLRSVDKDFG